MAVFKRVRCSNNKCKHDIAQVDKEPDAKMLAVLICPKCGSAPRVPSKWGVSVYLLGSDGRKHKHVKFSVGTKKEAEAYERRLLGEREDGAKHDHRSDWTFGAFAPEFLKWVEERVAINKLADSTALFYRKRLSANLLPWLNKIDIRQIDADMVDSYRLKRLKIVAASTVNHEVATLKKVLAVAVKKNWIRFNPLNEYEMLEGAENDRYLDDQEIEALLTACQDKKAPAHLYTIVMLALNTGLRIDGILGLRWEYVKWEEGEIHRIVKGGKLVRIPITDRLNQELRRWQTRDGVTRISGFLFPSTKKRVAAHDEERAMLITSNFGLRAACERAKIEDCNMHTLRHTFATHFLERHPDQMNVLMKIMGHSSSYMTRRYAHITDRARHKVMANFSLG